MDKPEVVTTRQIAHAAGIAPRTARFVLRDEYGFPCDGTRSAHVLAALSRTDQTPALSARTRSAAYAIRKCFVTDRMNLFLAQRVREQYTPYQLCAMVAKVANAGGDLTVGDLADRWINEHAGEL